MLTIYCIYLFIYLFIYLLFSQTDQSPAPVVAAPPPKALNIVRSSKVRYVEGYQLHKSTFLEKIPSLCKSIPGDSDGFAVSRINII